MTDDVTLQDDELDDADAALDALAAERQARKSGTPADVDPPEVLDKLAEKAEAAPASEPTAAPAAPVADEPFEGYSTLPEAVRKRFDEAAKKAAEADAYAEKLRKRDADFNALHSRMAPLQRKLSDYEKQPRQQQPQTPAAPGFNDWLKGTSKEYQQWAREFGEDAKLQYEHAMRVTAEADKRIRSVEESVKSQFQEMQFKTELSRLAATHSDYREFAFREVDGKREPLTQKAAEYFKWAADQGEDVQAAVYGDSADDVAASLSLYKWETSEPIVRETLYSPDFQGWLSSQSRHIQAMARSLDIDDRKDALHLFVGHLETSAPADPNAAKAKVLADKRQRQAANVSPSVRPTSAPASAVDGSEDAELDAVARERQQWRNRNR